MPVPNTGIHVQQHVDMDIVFFFFFRSRSNVRMTSAIRDARKEGKKTRKKNHLLLGFGCFCGLFPPPL
jgi:hypothetical protein